MAMLVRYRVAKLVNNVRNDSPECVKAVWSSSFDFYPATGNEPCH
jgi:hypothetical protein